ncbi:hypothetical protein D5086_007558 [Populus alba]|uniref:Uncharacterized protein n=1 Tax=Populus alba TaxID=43335 RepID=A0ACC4CPX0_POPAL
MRTESEDCSQLLRPENRKWQETNDAITQKIQEEPAAAYVTPEMREQPKSSSTVQHQKARRRQQSHRTPMKIERTEGKEDAGSWGGSKKREGRGDGAEKRQKLSPV